MEERATQAQNVFYIGLCIVLAAAILSAAWPAADTGLTVLLTAAGAVLALAGRLWRSRIQRLVRRHNSDLGSWAIR